jgi:hypothetical protein
MSSISHYLQDYASLEPMPYFICLDGLFRKPRPLSWFLDEDMKAGTPEGLRERAAAACKTLPDYLEDLGFQQVDAPEMSSTGKTLF